MPASSFISDALAQPADSIFHRMSELLAGEFPDKFMLETESHFFDVTRYAADGRCSAGARSDLNTQWEWYWEAKHGDYRYPYNGWFQIGWQGKSLQLVMIGHFEGHCRQRRQYLIADSEEVARRFFREVCLWNSEVRGEVLVFDQGRWYKSSDLFESIQTASFDNLILEGSLKEDVQQDIGGFFEAEATYGKYGIAWKRGVLFLGPPGNGKTHAVKAVINSLAKPCLYVKSFAAEYQTDQDNIGQVFERARDAAPCILVLEDLDSLITKQNRSFFLNEMDGFASNHGILTLATTNHPERLDPAILERPSRFDRKYTFKLPALQERVAYLNLFSSRLQADLQLSEEGVAIVSSATDGYSFAYLKELYLSSMMRWIANPNTCSMADLMVAQSDLLRSQMSSDSEEIVAFSEDDEPDGFEGFPAMARRMMMMRTRRRG